MDLSRRSFVIGAGSIITSSFVARASTFAENSGKPFLLPQLNTPRILYASPTDGADGQVFALSLGEAQCEPDFVPTWREFFVLEGEDPDDPIKWRELSENWALTRADLRSPMDDYTWCCSWSCRHSPSARAFRFLEELDLHRETAKRPALGGLEFNEGQYPGSWDRWVDADDALSVSLLQARLRELKVPVELRLGERQ